MHSVGLQPGSHADVAATVEAVRDATGPDLPIITAVGGTKGASSVSSASNAVLLGTGLDTAVLRELGDIASSGPENRARWLYGRLAFRRA